MLGLGDQRGCDDKTSAEPFRSHCFAWWYGARGGGMRSIHSLRSLHRLTIRPISAGSSSKAKTRRVLLYLGRFGLQTLPGSSYFA
ncbi:uncharacterized protein LOC135592253 isoform X2 [Musa acuminata AAA Group]|uniref:uncharacterized protein LOC135592253 isoform X2 n=1 Tax=Musa acuminata AAA Group TaxID=214697 RepID=UPI0031D13BB4